MIHRSRRHRNEYEDDKAGVSVAVALTVRSWTKGTSQLQMPIPTLYILEPTLTEGSVTPSLRWDIRVTLTFLTFMRMSDLRSLRPLSVRERH